MYLTNLYQWLPMKCCACKEVYFASSIFTSGQLHDFAHWSCQNQRRVCFQYEKALFPIIFLALSVKFPDFFRFSLTNILFPVFSRFSRLWTTMSTSSLIKKFYQEARSVKRNKSAKFQYDIISMDEVKTSELSELTSKFDDVITQSIMLEILWNVIDFPTLF